jgi:glycosyltransferase involved in cell wall biosynthesis
MEYRCHYLAREWVRWGHAVTIVGASYSHVRSRQPAIDETFTRETLDGVGYVWCRTPAYQGNGVGRVVNIAAFLLRLRVWPRWLDWRPDVVIASSTYPADIGPALAIARAYRATLAWEIHDLWPLSPIELGGMSRLHPFILWMQHAENRACRESDVIISMLPKVDEHLRHHGMRVPGVVYVPNGIDPSEWTASDAMLPERVQIAIDAARARGHILVAYTGAHGLANALDTLLDAAARLRSEPVSWFLVGDGPERSRLATRVEIENLSNVCMLEPVAKAVIPALLRSMDLLYIGLQRQPLFRFGISPNKLMDYMMAGRPVICAIDAGNDLVNEAGCGLTIAPEDPDALAGAVRTLMARTTEERTSLGRNGAAYVQARHSYRVLAAKFIDALLAAEQ